MPRRIALKNRRQKHFIREWREYRQLTQERLAARLDMSSASLSRIEAGKQPYTQDVLESIAEALTCEPADLLVRNPLDPAAPWSIWENLKPSQRKQAIRLLMALGDEGSEAA